jgi:antitoxin MazE
MAKQAVAASVNQWGNGLAVRLTKAVAKAAGVTEGTPVRIIAQRGRIIIEKEAREPTLEEMLAAFDPKRHGGEIMPFAPVGKEAA